MAGIAKIYCSSKKNFVEFYNWCKKFDFLCKKETQLSLLDYFYVTPEEYDTAYSSYAFGVPITCFRESTDMWLLKHCPIEWVRNYILNVQYVSVKIKPKDINLYLDYGRN